MFENEIKFISDFTLNKVKELGSFITVEKLLSTDIHPSIKKYVEGEINYLIYEDRKKLIENSLFDYSGKEIANYFDLIADEIKKTKKISFEDIKNIILQAVSFNANFVVRPKWSLSKLIFGNNKNVSINEIQMMLNYTYYFEYLNNVLLGYLSKKKILSISNTEFELIVNKIDRELFMLHQSKLVDNALYAIADYYSIGGLNKSNVSIDSVEIFLKEKNLTELLFKLKRNYSGNTKKKVDIDELRKVLYSALSVEFPFPDDEKSEEVNTGEEAHFKNPLDFDMTEDSQHTVDNKSSSGSSDRESYEESNQNLKSEEHEISADSLIKEDTSDKSVLNAEEIESTADSLYNETIIKENSIAETIEDVELANTIEPEETDPAEQEILSDEKILSELTEELDKEKNDEIIILDDKEHENLLNFYDNELEISVDEEISMIEDNGSEMIIDDSLEDQEDKEVEIQEKEIHEPGDEVPLEKIDFEKDLLGIDESESDKNSQAAVSKRRSDDIFNYLSKKEIDKIVKSLFNSDSEDFANTVEKMNDCGSYEEATHILDNVFKYARIKPHSKEANLLKDAVAKYYNVDR